MFSNVLQFVGLKNPKVSYLSPSSPHSFHLGGKFWKTVQHYYHAQKFLGTPKEEIVRQAKNANEAERIGRSKDKYQVIPGWGDGKLQAMYAATAAKFVQNKDIQKKLLATGNLTIVSDAKRKYWGGGVRGNNQLGKILMDVRRDLRRKMDVMVKDFGNRSKTGGKKVSNVGSKKGPKGPILFYAPENAYGFFSNYSNHGFKIEGRWWPTSEHYFQAKKYENTLLEEEIRKARNPDIAKKTANNAKNQKYRTYSYQKWEKIKEKFMRNALYAKFQQNLDIKDMLLKTGDRKLIENAQNDYYWGCGAKKTGKNRLGVLLMEVRGNLKKKKSGNRVNSVGRGNNVQRNSGNGGQQSMNYHRYY